MRPPLPGQEAERLEDLSSYQILDTPPEQPFDDLTRLAALICGTPVALIGFIDWNRQWFKARVGWDIAEIPRELSFCVQTIQQSEAVVISDTLTGEKKSRTSPLATHGGVRFYAGVPLRTEEGHALGTLCVMDSVPRALTEEQTDALQKLARQVMTQLEFRRRKTVKPLLQTEPVERPEGGGALNGILRESEALYRSVSEAATDAIIVINENSTILFVNPATERIFGYRREELLGHELTVLMPDYLRHVHRQAIKKYVETGIRHLSWEGVEIPGLHKNGAEIQLEISFGEFVRDGKHIFTGICRDITARKRSEEQRRRMAAIVESSEDAIIGKDLDGNIMSWNRGAERIYGYAAEEIIGKPVSTLVPAERAEEIPQIMERLKRGKRIENYETVRINKSGKLIPLSLSVSPIYDEAGRIIGGSAIGRDMTERKRAEETLRAKETQLRLLFEQMPAVLWTTDTELRITSSAGAGLAGLGVRSDELVGKRLPDYFRTDDLTFAPIAAHRQALQAKSVGYVVQWKGRVFEAHVEPLRDSKDSIVGCIGVAIDVTLQRQTEEALRASEQRYRSVFEGAVHGIFRVSVDGQFLEVNPALVSMLGYDSSADLLRLNAANVYANPEERPRLVQKRLETERIEEEVNWKRRNGEVIRVRLSGRTLTDPQGAIRGFEFIAEDVTERRALEAQLRQAQKIEAVGQLAGGIAHEFNNFLGIILGYSELMSEEAGESEGLRQKAAEIKAATQRAASLTRQLLAFSRKQLLEPKVLDLNYTVWETHKLLRRLVPAGVDIVPVLAPEIGRVKVDPGQVQQILINLVVNARDAMPGVSGKVVVETGNVDVDAEYASRHMGLRPGSYVTLSVSDGGAGMDGETLAHIFEPFFTTKAPGKGTGLGLSTVYGIVKQSGGYITVDSALGKGSTFRIYLPLVQAVAEEHNQALERSIEKAATETILIVEDEAALRKLLCLSLERLGYKVVAAKDGAEATEILEHPPSPIHVVVSDILMPRVDGLELKRRAATLSPNTKFLFMSGYSADIVEQRQTQGCAFLEKPFLPDELASKVRQLLEGEAAA